VVISPDDPALEKMKGWYLARIATLCRSITNTGRCPEPPFQQSGSSFLAAIRLIISWLRPLGARSLSTSVTKPHMYSESMSVEVREMTFVGVSTTALPGTC